VQKLLLQLDSAPHPSVFDRVVAFDAGADHVLSYGGVTPDAVRDLVHGAIFTRGPRDLHHTAIFIGGPDVAAGERLFAAAQKAFFGPMRVSVMLDANGSNTTAVAAVMRAADTIGDLRDVRAVVIAGSGPVGTRAAGLLAQSGADVLVTSRRAESGALAARISARFGGRVEDTVLASGSDAARVLDGAELVINAGPAGVRLVPLAAWSGRSGLRVLIDLNAVPPLGIEGVEPVDKATERNGARVFGALGVGGLKMKTHKACIARLFERNDLLLDAEEIAQIARELIAAGA
jgi:methylenetetrahydrofolate/methylenetetrahydromethanopterin dehydrogenase (NADP+)